MWIIAAFDLPMLSPEEKKSYNKFRKFLIKKGFYALQKSVYIKYYFTTACARSAVCNLSMNLPEKGKVVFFTMTDTRFSGQEFFENAEKTAPPHPPEQFIIFDDSS